VYYLNAFPGNAFEIFGADAASFEAFDTTYARDKFNAHVNGKPLAGAAPSSFELLGRPGFAKDSRHVYQRDRPISSDPAHFEFLDGNLAKDSTVVYWSDGTVLSDDPVHFAIVSNTDHYLLFTKDSRTVRVNGKQIPGADPQTFRVLQGAYARDDRHVFYFTDQLTDAEAPSFRALEGPLRKRLEKRLLNGKGDHRRRSGHVPRAQRRLRVLSRSDARLLPAISHRRRGSRFVPTGAAVTGCTQTSISFAQ